MVLRCCCAPFPKNSTSPEVTSQIRHLASGVLGPNAPEPFAKNSKAQTIVWDGKNDQGRYVEEKDEVVVRVSLGLKRQFERALFWHPKKLTAMRRHARPGGLVIIEPWFTPETWYPGRLNALFVDEPEQVRRDINATP